MTKSLSYIVDTVMESSSVIRCNIISLFTVQLKKKCEHLNTKISHLSISQVALTLLGYSG